MRKLIITALIFPSLLWAIVPVNKIDLDKRIALFKYPTIIKKVEFEKPTKRKKYSLNRGIMTVNDHTKKSDMDINFLFYKSKSEQCPCPVLIVLPSIDGISILEKTVARYFAKRGVHTFIGLINDKLTDSNRPISDINNFLIRTTAAIGHLIDYSAKLPEVDKTKVGTYGVSLGGIRAILATSIDKRIAGAFTFISGGNFPEILSYSQHSIVRNFREARMKAEKLSSVIDFRDKVDRNLLLDPLYFAHLRESKRYFMVISNNDFTVPTHNQWELWHALGRPQKVEYESKHYNTALRFPFYLNESYDFFQDLWI